MSRSARGRPERAATPPTVGGAPAAHGGTAHATTRPVVASRTLAWTAVVLLGACYGLHRLVDPDLFQHVAVGRAILAHPSSIGVSTFIRGWPDFRYVEDKWLGSVLVALFDRVGGADGLMLYQIGLCVAVVAAWYAMLRRWEASRAVALLGVALGLVVCAFRLEPRPDTASHALLAATFALVAVRAPLRRQVVVTGALFVLWINLHGYFVNGLLVLVAAALATALGDRTLGAAGMASTRERLVLLVVAVAACFVHPQGWRALASPVAQLMQLRSAGFHAGIQEMEPVGRFFTGASAAQWVVLLGPFAGALGLALAGTTGVRRATAAVVAALPWLLWPPAAMADAVPYRLTAALVLVALVDVVPAVAARRLFAPLVLLGFTVLTIPAVRNLPLLVPATLVLLAPAWTAIEGGLSPRGRAAAAAVLGVLVLGVAWVRLSDRLNGDVRAPTRSGWGVDTERFPVAATDFVVRAGLADTLLNGFDDGGYLLYRLHPGRRVFIAGNTSMYPTSFFEDYRARVTGPALDLEALASREGIDTVIWDLASAATDRLFAALAADPRWKLAFLDAGGVVFTRAPGTPAIDLPARVAALLERDVSAPALPTWLGGKRLEYPALNLGAFLFEIGRPDLALTAAERLWTTVPTARIATLIGSAAARTDTLVTRLPLLLSALDRWPASPELRNLGFAALAIEAGQLLGNGKLPEARAALDRMRTLEPNACGPYTGLAKIAALTHDPAEARTMIAAALTRDHDTSCRQCLQGDPDLSPLLPR